MVPPLRVSDDRIRRQLQLAGLKFIKSRARWVHDEAKLLELALRNEQMTPSEVDIKLEQLGMLDLVYPELMGQHDVDSDEAPC